MEQQESRRKKEINMLLADPPEGIHVWTKNDSTEHLSAQIQGPKDTPYEQGVFQLDINLTGRYPFEPPSIRFVTPIYHPNIDKSGRICMELLKHGSWRPMVTIGNVLTSIRLLMANPTPEDPLVIEMNKPQFDKEASAHTLKHAKIENAVCDSLRDEKNKNEIENIKPVSSLITKGKIKLEEPEESKAKKPKPAISLSSVKPIASSTNKISLSSKISTKPKINLKSNKK